MARLFLGLLGFYQRMVSPLFPPSCRFFPTCSSYSREAILRYGALKGLGFTLKRLFRCHPLGGHGYDPVPVLERKKHE